VSEKFRKRIPRKFRPERELQEKHHRMDFRREMEELEEEEDWDEADDYNDVPS